MGLQSDFFPSAADDALANLTGVMYAIGGVYGFSHNALERLVASKCQVRGQPGTRMAHTPPVQARPWASRLTRACALEFARAGNVYGMCVACTACRRAHVHPG